MGANSFLPSFDILLYLYGGYIVGERGAGCKKNQNKKKGSFSSGALTDTDNNKNGQRLRRLLHFLFQQFRNDLPNHVIGQGADFLLRFCLNRVLDENRFVLGHAEG